MSAAAVAIWVALIALASAVITAVVGFLATRRAQNAESAREAAQERARQAEKEKAEADRVAQDERAERQRMDERWNLLIQSMQSELVARATELERRSAENMRQGTLIDQLRQQLMLEREKR